MQRPQRLLVARNMPECAARGRPRKL